MSDFNTWLTDEIVCPHCGHEYENSTEFLFNSRDNGDDTCDVCEKEFHWEAEYSVAYTTSVKPNE
jgi:transcription elongation factor Elf1